MDIPNVNPEYLVTDEELQEMFAHQESAPTHDLEALTNVLSAMLKATMDAGFSRQVAEQIVFESYRHGLRSGR